MGVYAGDAPQAQHEPRRIHVPIPADVIERWAEDDLLPPNYIEHELAKVMDGPTKRLACRACGDVPPIGAQFCIECGATL